MKNWKTASLVFASNIVLFTGCDECERWKPIEPEPHVEVKLDQEEEIPSTLEAAVKQLEEGLSAEDREMIKALEFEDDMVGFHMGVGMGIRNAWGLWGDSPLALHMRELGLTHADDMSSVILQCLWCKIHNESYRIEEKVEWYKAYWRNSEDPPRTAVDPQDSSVIDWRGAVSVEGRLPRRIYFGKSKKTGRWVAFEHTVGVYLPDESLMKVIEDREKAVERDPFGVE